VNARTGYQLRLAGDGDDGALGELLVSAFVDTYRRKLPQVVVTERRKAELRATAAKRQVARVWVAEADGALAGTVALWEPGAPGSEAFFPRMSDIRHLAVDPRHRGRGLSGLLLDAAEAHARTVGEGVCLHVRRGAEGVKRLYQRRGYQLHAPGDLDLLPEVYLEALVLRWP
jgi:GNAT superfamily N-acetyltransferase